MAAFSVFARSWPSFSMSCNDFVSVARSCSSFTPAFRFLADFHASTISRIGFAQRAAIATARAEATAAPMPKVMNEVAMPMAAVIASSFNSSLPRSSSCVFSFARRSSRAAR